jgi:hypothetical protein
MLIQLKRAFVAPPSALCVVLARSTVALAPSALARSHRLAPRSDGHLVSFWLLQFLLIFRLSFKYTVAAHVIPRLAVCTLIVDR